MELVFFLKYYSLLAQLLPTSLPILPEHLQGLFLEKFGQLCIIFQILHLQQLDLLFSGLLLDLLFNFDQVLLHASEVVPGLVELLLLLLEPLLDLVELVLGLLRVELDQARAVLRLLIHDGTLLL